MKGCGEYKILPTTPYSLLLNYHCNGTSTEPASTGGKTLPSYKVSTISSVTIKPFSGITSEYKKWYDGVLHAYGICGYQDFLTDEALCEAHNNISYSIKCNLSQALVDGTLSFLCEQQKDERNAARFLNYIKDKSDEQANHHTREFKAWWHLFTHSFEVRDDFKSFTNEYNRSISILKEAGSIGVQDDVLLRALLIKGIQCDEFQDVKGDITKDLDMKPTTILVELKKTHTALESDDQLNESTKPHGKSNHKIRNIRRGNSVSPKSDLSHSTNSPTTKRVPYIPRWPKGLYEVCTKKLWAQLSEWKALVNKTDATPSEKRRLDNFQINILLVSFHTSGLGNKVAVIRKLSTAFVMHF